MPNVHYLFVTVNSSIRIDEYLYEEYMSKLTLEELKSIAHQPKDLVVECLFDQTEDDSECLLLQREGGHKLMLMTYKQNLCYTFNYHWNSENETKKVPGDLQGIELLINLESMS